MKQLVPALNEDDISNNAAFAFPSLEEVFSAASSSLFVVATAAVLAVAPITPPLKLRAEQLTTSSSLRLNANGNANTSLAGFSDLHQFIVFPFQNTIDSYLLSAIDEEFELGKISVLSRRLTQLVKEHDLNAITAIVNSLLQGRANMEVTGEVLQWLGDLEHFPSQNIRRNALEHFLSHQSTWVRDGALLGLESLSDPDALPALQSALLIEKIPEMKRNIQGVVDYLSRL